jgi:hypothetical protein
VNARGPRARRAALAALAAALLPAAAGGQEPTPRDTAGEVRVEIPPEAVRADTLPDAGRPESAAADSLLPAPEFPVFPEPRSAGFGRAVWVFGPAELGRFHALTLLELLDRIPALPVVREGDWGRPAGVGPLGAGGGRMRVFLDGWELRDLAAASPDLQHVPLADVQEVRVTRGLAEVRVDVQTLRLADARPFAQIEGGEGDFGIQMLRGVFARPFGPLMAHVGLDVSDTGGFRRASRFSRNTAFARVGWRLGPDRGLQLDYRSTSLDANRTTAQLPLPSTSFDRSELVLRGRARLGAGLWMDAALGRTVVEPAESDTLTPPAESVQAVLRAALDVPLGVVSGSARLHRSGGGGPAPDAAVLEVAADLAPSRRLGASAVARTLSVGGVAGLEVEATVRAAASRGIAVFGSVAGGSRGIPVRLDTVLRLPTLAGAVNPSAEDSVDVPAVVFPVRTSTLGGARAGIELSRGSGLLGVAFVTQEIERWMPFGFAYERGLAPADGGTVGAVEASLSVPLVWRQLRLDAHVTDFLAQPARPYLPRRFGRAALEYHWIYRGGALEPTLRAEAVVRDAALAPDPETGSLDRRTEPYAFLNLFVQVRVLDVRAFWRMENLVNRTDAEDVPGFALPGNRAMFGVRWFFRD